MVNAQEWLEENYPKEEREQYTELDIGEKNLEGELDLSDFVNLGDLDCRNNKLTKLVLNNCPKLRILDCFKNKLIELDLGNNWELEDLNCPYNKLKKIKFSPSFQLCGLNCSFNNLDNLQFLEQLDPKKLRILMIYNNFFLPQDLTVFSRFINLENLGIGTLMNNRRIEWMQKDIKNSNRFYGSFKPLENLTNLQELSLYSTDIDSGLEYLPESLEVIFCAKNYKLNYGLFAPTHAEKIRKQLGNYWIEYEKEEGDNMLISISKSIKDNFSQLREKFDYQAWRKDNQELIEKVRKEKWIERGFSEQEIEQWIEAGLEFGEYEFANYLVQQNYHPTIPNIENIITQESWKDIHEGFDYSKRKGWEKVGNKEEVKEWIQAGAELEDYKFVSWLQNTKKEKPKWITNYEKDYQILSNRFKRHGLCEECKQPNTGEQWCQPCNKSHLFAQPASSNPQVNEFILEHQLQATDRNKFLEWIPYEQFKDVEKAKKELQIANSELQSLYSQYKQLNKSRLKIFNTDKIKKIKQKIDEQLPKVEKLTSEAENKIGKDKYKVEYLAEGGFGKVYKAKWVEGTIYKWDKKSSKWERRGDKKTKERHSYYRQYENYKTVVLKSFTNTQNITQEFLNEVANHKIIDDWFESIVPCYGISQDPETGNYLMVMEYVEGGNLRELLKKDYHNLSFQDKLQRLINITQGLKDIHQKDLIHRDFHSGNILSDNRKCFITDLGLSKPASSKMKEGKILGVMPYVAPEVLQSQPYTPASDIYSLGMIMYELFTGCPPFANEKHDTNLALKICRGERPQFPEQVKYPQLLVDLIKRCWDDEPNNRPTVREINGIVSGWEKEFDLFGEKGEFYHQIQEAEEYNKTLPDEIRYPNYHSAEVWHSKPINTQQITQLLQSSQLSDVDLEDLTTHTTKLNLEDYETELVAQQEIPPK